MKNTETSISIMCPDCGEDNVLARPWELICNKCNKPITKGHYSKASISAFTAFILGIGGSVGTIYMMDAGRYPIGDEHAIIEICINPSTKPMALANFHGKRKNCICALERTQDELDLETYEDKSSNTFISTFEKNADECNID